MRLGPVSCARLLLLPTVAWRRVENSGDRVSLDQIEASLEMIPAHQKKIIERANRAGKLVVTATEIPVD